MGAAIRVINSGCNIEPSAQLHSPQMPLSANPLFNTGPRKIIHFLVKRGLYNRFSTADDPFMIKGLHHVQITVPRGAEDQAREFYCRVLGFREIEKPAALRSNGGFWLELPDRQLHIGVENGIDRNSTKAHLAYEVENLEAMRSRIKKTGIKIKDQPTIPGLKRFKARDPFGNQIEFVEKVKP